MHERVHLLLNAAETDIYILVSQNKIEKNYVLVPQNVLLEIFNLTQRYLFYGNNLERLNVRLNVHCNYFRETKLRYNFRRLPQSCCHLHVSLSEKD